MRPALYLFERAGGAGGHHNIGGSFKDAVHSPSQSVCYVNVFEGHCLEMPEMANYCFLTLS